MYHHPSQLRIANVRRAFRTLLARGPRSRADLARLIGLSPVTAGKVVDAMLETGLVQDVEDRVPAGDDAPVMGRPPRLVGLSSAVRLSVVEIGARETVVRRIALADAANADLALPRSDDDAPSSFATPNSVEAFAAELERVVGRMVGRSSGRTGSHSARGATVAASQQLPVLVSVPGVLSADAEEILFSPNLRWTNGRELLARIGRIFGTRTCAVQEIQALALGQVALGGGPDSFVLVDLGDGVGGAVVSAGQLLHGPQPLCGELGHTGVFGNRRRCGCGAVGCLETLVSRGGLLQSYRTRRRRPDAPWTECARHVASHGVEPWLAPSIDAAATVIAGALNLVGSADLVLTGELPALHPEVLVAFERRVQEHALVGRFARLTCHLAARRRILGLVAAAADRVLLPEPAMPAAELDPPASSERSRRRPLAIRAAPSAPS